MPCDAMLPTDILDDLLIKTPFATNFASPRDRQDQEPVAANYALEPPVIVVIAHADGGNTLGVQVEGSPQRPLGKNEHSFYESNILF